MNLSLKVNWTGGYSTRVLLNHAEYYNPSLFTISLLPAYSPVFANTLVLYILYIHQGGFVLLIHLRITFHGYLFS